MGQLLGPDGLVALHAASRVISRMVSVEISPVRMTAGSSLPRASRTRAIDLEAGHAVRQTVICDDDIRPYRPRASASACLPSAAAAVRWPSLVNRRASISRTDGSSSTTRIARCDGLCFARGSTGVRRGNDGLLASERYLDGEDRALA